MGQIVRSAFIKFRYKVSIDTSASLAFDFNFILMMDIESIVNLGSTLASAVAFGSNYFSYRYIVATYDTTKSPYYILALDSRFAADLSLLGATVGFFEALLNQSGPISCSMKILTNPVIVAIQPYLTFFISLIRLKRLLLNSPNGWRPEKQLINFANLSLIVLFLLNLSIILANSWFELNLSVAYNFCLKKSFTNTNILPILALIILPINLISFTTAAMDLKCFCIASKSNKKLDKVPLRATILSTIFILPQLIIGVIFGKVINFSPLTQYLVSLVNQYILIIFRNPLIVLIAFRVNETNRFHDRETKRSREIAEALKEREQRRAQPENRIQIRVTPSPRSQQVSSLPQVSC